MNLQNGKRPVIDPGLCRCCGVIKKCRLLNVEYYYSGEIEVYSDMFVDCFGLLLSNLDGDEKERVICATCVLRLRDACNFKRQVLTCQQNLLRDKVHINNESSLQSILDESSHNNENHDKSLFEDNLNSDDEPLTNFINCETSNSDQMYSKYRRKRKSVGNLKNKSQKMRLKTGANHGNLESTDHCIESKKIFANIITIVENSFVCPFNTFYNTYFCVYCRKKFFNHEKLRDHSLTHDPTNYQDVLSTLTQNNKKCQIDISRIDCRLCSERIIDINEFKLHITKVHGKCLFPISNEFLKFRLDNLKCTECNMSFSSFYPLKKHMAEHFAAYICDMCGVHYFEQRMLIAHLKTHKPNSLNFPCTRCGKNFKVKYNLQIHTARVHTKEPAFMCSKCDETFFSDSLRQRHMIDSHGEESIFKCDHCEKVYNTKKKLRDHNRMTHLKLLKHVCNLCEKSFYLPSRLKEHMSCHTGERNFRCEHCGKSFQRLRTLKVHVQCHSTDKKYKCTQCNASYSQNVCLKNHVKRHHKNFDPEKSFAG